MDRDRRDPHHRSPERQLSSRRDSGSVRPQERVVSVESVAVSGSSSRAGSRQLVISAPTKDRPRCVEAVEVPRPSTTYVKENLRERRHHQDQSEPQRSRDLETERPLIKPKNCAVCGPIVTTNMTRHIDQHHVPWYVTPEFACWACKENCGSGPFTARHSHHDPLMMSDSRLDDWLVRITGLLEELRVILGCSDLEQLLELVIRRKWYPDRGGSVSARQFLHMRLWARSVGRTVPETCALTPPDDVSILVNRVVFRCIMVALTQTEREFLMNWEPPQSSLMPRGTMLIVDSHTHLDRIMSQTGCQPWLIEGVPTDTLQAMPGAFQLQYIICSLNFRRSWPYFRELLEDPRVYVTAGYHPHETSGQFSTADLEKQAEILEHPRCLAFGEIGLDYFTHSSTVEKERQHHFLKKLLPVAAEKQRRIVIHCRDGPTPREAQSDLLEIMKELLPPTQQVYLHHFCGTSADVDTWRAVFPEMYFGLPAGYRRTDLNLSEALLRVPLDRLLAESDAPYKLKGPWELPQVFREVGALLNMSTAMVAELTRFNACSFYGLPQ